MSDRLGPPGSRGCADERRRITAANASRSVRSPTLIRSQSLAELALNANSPTHPLIPGRDHPFSTSICSKSGACLTNSACSSGVQKPITRSTPARLYQDRSKSTISPAAGKCEM